MRVDEALAPTELELVKLAALGMTNRQIGLRVERAENTIKHAFVGIFDKVGVWSRLELVMRWMRETYEPRPEL